MMFLDEADQDGDGDGEISKEEFVELVEDKQVRMWLSSMEIDASDAPTLFDLLDESKDGYLTCDELVKGVAKLKGGARSIDLATLMCEQRVLLAEVAQIQAKLDNMHTPIPGRLGGKHRSRSNV